MSYVKGPVKSNQGISLVILLRPFIQSDFARLIQWIDSHEALVQWSGPTQFTFPLTDEQLIRYQAESTGVLPSRLVYAATDVRGDVVGHIELGAIDYVNRTATLCRVLIAPEARGKRCCVGLVRQILRVGFEELKLRRIDLKVFAFNHPAIRCYERAGFVREGVLRKSRMIGEKYWDTVLMGILREEWRPLT